VLDQQREAINVNSDRKSAVEVQSSEGATDDEVLLVEMERPKKLGFWATRRHRFNQKLRMVLIYFGFDPLLYNEEAETKANPQQPVDL